ncbi:hypothetical protein SAMN05428978_10799 [Nitrosomonas sp. Nm34]|nr:hypothetical protein SAMN05428978_10799 [Nitrosomonas sp. Nm34]
MLVPGIYRIYAISRAMERTNGFVFFAHRGEKWSQPAGRPQISMLALQHLVQNCIIYTNLLMI